MATSQYSAMATHAPVYIRFQRLTRTKLMNTNWLDDEINANWSRLGLSHTSTVERCNDMRADARAAASGSSFHLARQQLARLSFVHLLAAVPGRLGRYGNEATWSAVSDQTDRQAGGLHTTSQSPVHSACTVHVDASCLRQLIVNYMRCICVSHVKTSNLLWTRTLFYAISRSTTDQIVYRTDCMLYINGMIFKWISKFRIFKTHYRPTYIYLDTLLI